MGAVFEPLAAFTDPGGDVWTASVDYGDGAGPVLQSLDGKSFEVRHTYRTRGTFMVTATVNDDDGGSGSAQASVVVLSTSQATRQLLAALGNLVASGALSRVRAFPLGVTLFVALVQIEFGRPTAAANALTAFINQVNALVQSGRLAFATAEDLIIHKLFAGRAQDWEDALVALARR